MSRPGTARPSKNVAAYIAAAPKAMRGTLRALRAIIRNAAPRALEKISYRIPYDGYKGRLVYFGYATQHIGLYVPSPVLAMHRKELKGYHTTMATLRLPLGRKVPIALITKLVKARLALNEAGKGKR